MRASTEPQRRRIALVGGMHVGVETVFVNLSRAIGPERDWEAVSIPIDSYRRDWIERGLGFLPKSARGTLRYTIGTSALFRSQELDAVWSLLDIPILPWMAIHGSRSYLPVIYAADSTPRQLRAFGSHYGHWGGRSDLKFHARETLYRALLRRVAAVHVYTEWAAGSMRADYGVPASRVHVLPPGVDTDFWRPEPRPERESGPVRVLFVGGDFHRKGGDLLLRVYRERLRGRAELHLVTRPGAAVPEPGVHVHAGLRPNDDRLRRLYQTCDVLAIPTRADCFSMAGLEGMASGLPLVTCPVGGVGEVFVDGEQGCFVPPNDADALAATLEALVENLVRRRRMGAAARKLACARYDVRTNARRLLDLVERVIARQSGDDAVTKS